MTEQASFAQRLKHHRVLAGLSQEALAEEAAISVHAISALERGVNTRPQLETVRRLAVALRLDPAGRGAMLAAARPNATVHAPAPPEPLSTVRFDELPVPPTPLLGRDADLARLAERLSGTTCRLLTLVGPGGTGKTRLALALAGRVRDHFAAGVNFVDLSPLTDPPLVLPAIAGALKVREVRGQPLLERVKDALWDKQLLLVLDNFERVADAAPVVADLLAACSRLVVLVTSRVPLRLRGESEFFVPPLALPDLAHLPEPTAMTAYPAVALFHERVIAVRPNFAITATNAAEVAAICVRLDGLPLALELAAARTRILDPEALLARLTKSLGVLTGGARDLPTRHHTLRDTIAWSYELLRPAERALFARLAIFAGGWTLTSAAAVCDPDGALGVDVLDGLDTLVSQSLARPTHESGTAPRLRMLETIREFAWERLEARGEAATLQRRHATHFLALAEAASPQLVGPEQAVWMGRLDGDLDNLRAALAWARDRGEGEIGLRLAGALGRFWGERGYIGEGRDWLEGVIARADMGVVPAAVRARVLYAVGTMANLQGDQELARQWLDRSIACYREIADPIGAVRALNALGGVAYDAGDLAGAVASFEECLALLRATNDRGEVARALGNLGEALYHRGDLVGAAARYEEALAYAKGAGRDDVVAYVLGNLGNIARRGGDLARAMELHREALERKATLGARRQIAITLEDLACLAAAEGQGERAARLLGAAQALRAAISSPRPVPEQQAVKQATAGGRAALGEEGWAVAFAAGLALPLEAAIASALQD